MDDEESSIKRCAEAVGNKTEEFECQLEYLEVSAISIIDVFDFRRLQRHASGQKNLERHWTATSIGYQGLKRKVGGTQSVHKVQEFGINDL